MFPIRIMLFENRNIGHAEDEKKVMKRKNSENLKTKAKNFGFGLFGVRCKLRDLHI